MLLGEILCQDFGVTIQDLEKGLQFQASYQGRIGSILVNMGVISDEVLIRALTGQLGLRSLAEAGFSKFENSIFTKAGELGLNSDFLLERRWLPLLIDEAELLFVALDPLDYEVNQYLNTFPVKWQVCIVNESRFRELAGEYNLLREVEEGTDALGGVAINDNEIDKLRELAAEAPVINLVNSLISRAVGRGASDLHLEPYNDLYRVRFRIDGILHDIDFLPPNLQLPITSRIKILAGMNIAERRRPQDGQISLRVASRELDIRVSTLPLAQGESLVLRFLVKESISYDLDTLGIEDDLVHILKEDILKTAGVILLTGPTGSGKTTTLYSCLNLINREDIKIITIEDPVEYQLEGINQIQIQPDIGYDFLNALRSILRQDPDVIMVGEIRDGETARVAMQSSLTGHLVFSTIHTNDAPTAYTRLIDLGVDEYLINSSLISVIAQRLVRRLCPACSRPLATDTLGPARAELEEITRRHGLSKITLKEAVGCSECAQTGYLGRIGILEYLRCTPELKALPKNSDFPAAARKLMTSAGIRSLREDGLLKVAKGVTTIEEVFRVCN